MYRTQNSVQSSRKLDMVRVHDKKETAHFEHDKKRTFIILIIERFF